jgi:hypothetical protein
LFHHEENKVRAVARGDDFTVLGRSKDLDFLRGVMENRMEVKFKERLSREREEAGRVLNRVV